MSRHERLQELFHGAREHEGQARAAWLSAACDDPELRAEVEALLAADVTTGDLLDRPAAEELGGWFAEAEDEAALPERIGPFRVGQRLGAGGMGIVHLAEQDRPRRVVALKLLRAPLATPAAEARFALEAEVLGRLQHPGIAQVFAAGTAVEDGRRHPWLAMELIQGVGLLEHAAGLDPAGRLQLVAAICDAVQHAHQRGVVHRDLKPANVLVDQRGQPKVLDFGVAQVAGEDAPPSPSGTSALVGTLPYMSPEQLGGDPARVGPASDVYALGVILYRLLADRLPIAVQGRSTAERVASLLREPPTPLLQADPRLPADLGWITARALARTTAERYASPAELAQDLRRFLEHRPVRARPATRAYVASRFVRRHRLAVAASLAVVVSLAAGVTASVREWRVAVRERRVAEAQAARSERLLGFLVDEVLSAIDPREGEGGDVLLADVVGDAAAAAEERFAESPEDLARILGDLASSYRHLSRPALAAPLLERAEELWTALAGPRCAGAVDARNQRALALRDQGRLEEALVLAAAALEDARRTVGPRHELALTCENNLALFLQEQGRPEEAEPLFEEVWRARQETLGADHPDTLVSRSNLAQVLRARGRPWEALPHLEAVLEGHERTLDPPFRARAAGDHHPETLISMDVLGGLYRELGLLDAAEPLVRASARGHEELLGLEHDDTLAARYKLGRLLLERGALQEALDLERESVAASLRLHGPRHRSTLFLQRDLARALSATGAQDEARALLRECLALSEELFGPLHPSTAAAAVDLGRLELAAGEPQAAAVDLEDALCRAGVALGPLDWRVASIRVDLGRALGRTGHPELAVPQIEEGRAVLEATFGPEHPAPLAASAALTEVRGDAGSAEE